MINDKKLFESRAAFCILMGIIALLGVFSVICSADGDNKGNLKEYYGVRQSGINVETGVNEYSADASDFGSNNVNNNYDADGRDVYGVGGDPGTGDDEGYEVQYRYVIIAEDEVIKLYTLDEGGGRIFLKDTGINYGLLSENDKRMMDEGIYVYSDESLESILQDFES